MSDDAFRRVTLSQFQAALEMVESAVAQCPDSAWASPVGTRAFWRVAYHALFYGDFYLCRSESDHTPLPWQRADENFLDADDAGPPLERETLLAFARHCRAKASAVIPWESDELRAGFSGFPWLPFTRAEIHVYNARHLQHHAGQLAAAIRAAGGPPVEWVGMRVE